MEEEWIDPHEMTDLQYEYQKNGFSNECSNIFIESYYKRLIGMMLSSLTADKQDPTVYKANIYFNVPQEDYIYLSDFLKRENNEVKHYKVVDKIVSQMYTVESFKYANSILMSLIDLFLITLNDQRTYFVLAFLFTILLSYKLLRARFTIWTVISYLLFISWVVDFIFTWIHLKQEAEINKMAEILKYKSIPDNCNPEKMSYIAFIKSAFSTEDECKKYHQVMLTDIFWTVRPLNVISTQFGSIIKAPAIHLGDGIGIMTSKLLGNLPWGVNVILLPLMLIFILFLLCIFFAFLTNTNFKLNLLHMFQINFGRQHRENEVEISNMINERLKRSLIENVKIIDGEDTVTAVKIKNMKVCKEDDGNGSEKENINCKDICLVGERKIFESSENKLRNRSNLNNEDNYYLKNGNNSELKNEENFQLRPNLKNENLTRRKNSI